MLTLLIMFAICFLLTIFLYTISILRRNKKQSVTKRRKLKELKKQFRIKAIIFKLLPIVIALIFLLIATKYAVRKLKYEQQSVTIYKDELQVTMLENELQDRIKYIQVDMIVYSIYIWIALDMAFYIFFIMSIRKDKSLKEDEKELLADYHSGKMMYKISLTIFCILLTKLIYEYMLTH